MADINVTLGGDARGLSSTIDSIKGKIGGFQKILAGISVGAFLKNIVDDMNKIDDVASNLNISTDFVQELQSAANLGGSNLETITDSFQKMSINLAKSDDKAIESLGKLGLSFADVRNMDPESAFKLIASKINDLPTYMDKATAATNILGKSSKDLMDAMSKMSQVNPMAKYNKEDIQAVADATDRLSAAYQYLKVLTAKGISNAFQGAELLASDLYGKPREQYFAEQSKSKVEEFGKAFDEKRASEMASAVGMITDELDNVDKTLEKTIDNKTEKYANLVEKIQKSGADGSTIEDQGANYFKSQSEILKKRAEELQKLKPYGWRQEMAAITKDAMALSEEAKIFAEPPKPDVVKEQKIDIPKLVDVQVGSRQAMGLYEAGFGDLQSKFAEQTKAIDVAKQQLSTLKRIEAKLGNQNNSFIVRD